MGVGELGGVWGFLFWVGVVEGALRGVVVDGVEENEGEGSMLWLIWWVALGYFG